MNLTRLFAYEVYPQKNRASLDVPPGGEITPQPQLKRTLAELVVSNHLESQTPITFVVDNPEDNSRSNSVREAVVAFAFGRGENISDNAGFLALRLSEEMDGRSNPFLLLISCFRDKGVARVVLWAFPKDEGLQFSATKAGVAVTVVEDVFHLSSSLRKAAMFSGTRDADSFWEGRMVDLQSGKTDLWVERFLLCRLSVNGVYGTKTLADLLNTAFRQTKSEIVREELFNAIVGVQTAPVKRTSFLKFANDYLGDNAKSEFLSVVPDDQKATNFDFDRETFEQKIGIRVLKTADRVIVAAPLATIGNSVRIREDQLSLSGTIESEYLKAGSRG